MNIRVLMLGPSLDSRGGMATFAKTVLAAWGKYGSKDVSIEYHPTVVPGSKLRKLAYGFYSYCSFGKKVKSVDIVHINFSLGASLPRKLAFAKKAKRCGKRLVLHSHTSALEKAIMENDPSIKTEVLPFLRLADAVVVLAQYWEGLLTSIGVDPECIHVVPNGVDTAGGNQVNPVVEPQSKVPASVIYLGRLEPDKGIDDLFAASALAISRGVDFKLVLAGTGEDAYIDSLEKKAKEASLVVQFLGWVEGEKKLDAINSSAVFVLPSHREVLPMSLLETMAAGLAPISTRVGAVPEVIEDGVNGLLCEPGDIESLAASLQKMCLDQKFRTRCSISARETIESHYSTRFMIAELQDVYEGMLTNVK